MWLFTARMSESCAVLCDRCRRQRHWLPASSLRQSLSWYKQPAILVRLLKGYYLDILYMYGATRRAKHQSNQLWYKTNSNCKWIYIQNGSQQCTDNVGNCDRKGTRPVKKLVWFSRRLKLVINISLLVLITLRYDDGQAIGMLSELLRLMSLLWWLWHLLQLKADDFLCSNRIHMKIY